MQYEKAHVERLLEPIRGTWKEKKVSVCSDRWTDAQRRPIINFMAVIESGQMFLNSVNAEGEKRNSLHSSLKIASKRLDLKMLFKSLLISLLHARMRVLLSMTSILTSFGLLV